MSELNARIDELTGLMKEYGLERARMKGADWSVEFAVEPTVKTAAVAAVAPSDSPATEKAAAPKKKAVSAPAGPTGTPVSSPMTGIFYTSSSPGSPAFAKVGDRVNAGQVVGLIEAMKVFNEITATISGIVTKVAADNGALVQPGDPLLYIE